MCILVGLFQITDKSVSSENDQMPDFEQWRIALDSIAYRVSFDGSGEEVHWLKQIS